MTNEKTTNREHDRGHGRSRGGGQSRKRMRLPINGQPLAWRLTFAFLVVALGAIFTMSAVSLVTSRNQLTTLVLRQHNADARAVANAVADAYTRTGDWSKADLASAGAIAARSQATLLVLDVNNNPVAAPTDELANLMASIHGIDVIDVPRGHEHTLPVLVNGQEVGTVQLRFPIGSLPGPEAQLFDAIKRNLGITTLLVSLGAILAAVVVSRKLAHPIKSLTAASQKLAEGDLSTRSSLSSAPGELAILGDTLNEMAEHLETEDALRKRMLADIAHELRTPLAILQAQTESIVDGIVSPDHQAFVSLHEEVVRLSRLVGDLESLSEAMAASLHLQFEPIDLAALVRRHAQMLLAKLPENVASVEQDLQPAVMRGAEDRVSQIVTNLLHNAVQYCMPGGSIWLSTSCDTEQTMLIVRNNSIKPYSDIDQLFERSHRGDNTHDIAGSGIGLAVTHELVKAHNGSISAGWANNVFSITVTFPPVGSGILL